MDATQKSPAAPAADPYGAEVLCASWNPLVALLAGGVVAARDRLSEAVADDVEGFLKRLYCAQRG